MPKPIIKDAPWDTGPTDSLMDFTQHDESQDGGVPMPERNGEGGKGPVMRDKAAMRRQHAARMHPAHRG